jgi:hypothetical protein
VFNRRIWLLDAIALVVVAVAATVLVIVLRKDDSNTTAKPPEPTAWQRIEVSADQNGKVGRETALQAFAYLFGGLPGVAQPWPVPTSPTSTCCPARSTAWW